MAKLVIFCEVVYAHLLINRLQPSFFLMMITLKNILCKYMRIL